MIGAVVRTIRLLRGSLLATMVLLGWPASFGQNEATTFRVGDEAGPLTLEEELAEAAAEWNRVAGENVILRGQDEGALIRFGDSELMGPDLVSLTLAPERSELEVLLNPDLYRRYPGSLLHELGIILGLPASRSGVMDPLLDPSSSARIGEEEIDQLRALRDRTPGDLDGDGVVGLADLAALGRAYGRSGVNLPADLNGDGTVDREDVEILRSEYRFVPPEQIGEPEQTDEPEQLEEPEQTDAPQPQEEPEPEPGPEPETAD